MKSLTGTINLTQKQFTMNTSYGNKNSEKIILSKVIMMTTDFKFLQKTISTLILTIKSKAMSL